MYLWKISAACPHFLPDIRNCIDPQNVNPLIDQEKEIIHHFVKHPRILIIQIPLVRIKGSQHVVSDFRKPGEIPRCSFRKYLWHCFLIFSDIVFIVTEKIPAHIFAFTHSCLLCPFMIFGSMVHYKIHTQIHVFFVAGFSQICKVFYGSKFRLYFSEIRNRIASIGSSLWRIEKRHQMNTVYTTFFQILKLSFDSS